MCAATAPSRCPLSSPPGSCGEEAAARREAADPHENHPGTPPAGVWEWGPAGTLAVPASAPVGLHQPSPPYPPRALAGCRAGKAFAIAPLAPAYPECQAGGGCGAAGPVLTVLCLQAAPGPASQLSPSEEAQRRLERIFTASVIPGALALACRLPGVGEAWAACGCPGRAVRSAQGDCTPVSGHQPHGPSPGGTGSGGWMTRAAGGFGDHCPDQRVWPWGAAMPSSPYWWHGCRWLG